MFFSSVAQNLNDGSVLFTHVQSDGNKMFTFVVMEDLIPNQQIMFTDNPIDSLGAFSNNEGFVSWIAPDTGVKKGVLVSIIVASEVYSTVGYVSSVSGSYNLSASGDQIFAVEEYSYFIDDMAFIDYEFIAAINYSSGNSWISIGEPSASKSYLPKGLTSVLSFSSHKDNGVFNCSENAQTTEQLRVSVLDFANWTTSQDILSVPCSSFFIGDVVGIRNQNFENGLGFYPNPVTGNQLFFESELTNVQVFDLRGQLIIEKKTSRVLNIEDLVSGIYVVKSHEGSSRFIVN